MTSIAKYAAFWLLVASLIYLGFNAFLSPKIARAVATDGTGIVTIDRSHDQHFYVEGTINGRPVTFMVDTGATMVSVNRDTARAIGLSPSASAVFDTAAGRSAGQVATDADVRVGPDSSRRDPRRDQRGRTDGAPRSEFPGQGRSSAGGRPDDLAHLAP
jgi:hypothetical protein